MTRERPLTGNLRPDGLAALRRYLEQLWEDAERRFVIAAENTATGHDKYP